jgi:outer membrane biosynthesis protein TonB
MKTPLASRVMLVAGALITMAGSADGQRTPCDSPCKLILLPLITHNDQPVPNSNPLRELQGKIQGQAQQPAVYFEYQVDKPAQQVPEGVAPHFPDSLRVAKVEGEVRAAFTVDTMGLADTTSLHILKSTHRLFSAAVRDALPQMRFIPAELHGAKVKQLVMQSFVFNLAR